MGRYLRLAVLHTVYTTQSQITSFLPNKQHSGWLPRAGGAAKWRDTHLWGSPPPFLTLVKVWPPGLVLRKQNFFWELTDMTENVRMDVGPRCLTGINIWKPALSQHKGMCVCCVAKTLHGIWYLRWLGSCTASRYSTHTSHVVASVPYLENSGPNSNWSRHWNAYERLQGAS